MFRSAPAAASLLSALTLLRQGEAGSDGPMDFVTPRWRRLIRASGRFNRKLYELCVFAKLRDALRAGDVWVEGSSKYRSFEERLLAPMGSSGVRAIGPAADILRLDPDAWIAKRRKKLDALLSEAERRAAAGALPDAAIRDGRLSVTPLKNATPDDARDLARRLYGLLPRVRITDLLEEVDGWTAMSDSFGHLRTGQPPSDRRALYAAIIADGLNLGLTRMAEACEGASYWRLARLVDWHIREESYALATRTLVEAQERAPIATLWGEGETSSSDGQHFSAAAQAVSTLAATTRQSGLAAALAEIGRIERTIFMLEWMLQPELRHRVQMGLNKGEARNNLARAVFFNRLGQLRDRSHENQQHRAAGCNLVVAAIICWNSVYLARAVETLRLAGTDVPDNVLRHLWPLGWDHINLTGDYRWSADNPKSSDQLRPLRLDRLRLPTTA